jgi:hypothetical protein
MAESTFMASPEQPKTSPPPEGPEPIPIKARRLSNDIFQGSSSPVFSDPDSPSTARNFISQPSNLSRAFAAAQVAPLPVESPSSSSNASPHRPAEPSVPENVALPLSSSPSPAFLPARSISSSQRLPRASALTKSLSYPGKLAYNRLSVRANESSAPSLASVDEPAHARKSSSRSSHSASDGISAAIRGRRPSTTGQGNPTLSTSFVSSLGRSSGAKAKDDVSGMDSLRASSASLELLSRFRKSVELAGDGSSYRKK